MDSYFIPARHGLGDIVANYFVSGTLPNIRLRQLIHAKLQGNIDRIMVIHEGGMTPRLSELWSLFGQRAGVEIVCKMSAQFNGSDGVLDADVDNRFPAIVHGFRNLLTNFDPVISAEENLPEVYLPTIKPVFVGIPDRFVLFSDSAGSPDRVLTHLPILFWIKARTGLPVIKVGQSQLRGAIGHTSGEDFNWINSLSLPETFWLAQHAAVIVAPLTFFRVFGRIFGTKVIELALGGIVSHDTVLRTGHEYAGGAYGISPETNCWFVLPAQTEAFLVKLKEITDGV